MKPILIDEYKSILVDMLNKIDCTCRLNGIQYSLAYGTLIGAIRHNGFIPWDDDLDIVMLRSDYEILRDLINSNDNDLAFIDYSTSDTIYPYGKICDTRTYLEEKNFIGIENYGAFIDVFPLDYLPNNVLFRKIYCFISRFLMIVLTHSSRTGFEQTSSIKVNFFRKLAFHLGHLFNPFYLSKLMNKLFISIKPSNIVGIPWGWGGLCYSKSMFLDLEEHEFENHQFFIPKQYDYILKTRYGNYLELPPLDEQKPRHQLFCYYR